MSLGGGRPPAPPDPLRVTMQQQQFAADAARQNASLNRINQSTPFGRLTYRQTAAAPQWDEEAYLTANPDVRNSGMSGQEHWQRFGRSEGRAGVPQGFGGGDQYEAVVELSPEEQRILSISQQGRAGLGQIGVDRLAGLREFLGGNPASRPDFAGIGDPNQSRDAVEQALLARLNPQLERERASMEARLANQGITMGSEAWRRGFDDFGRLSNDARLAAIAQAGQEQSRVFNLGLQQAQFANQARQQALGEVGTMLGAAQPNQPQFINAPQVSVETPDFAGAVQNEYLARLQAYQIQQQQRAAELQAIAQLGGAALGGVFGGPMGAAMGGMMSGLGTAGSSTTMGMPSLRAMSQPGFFAR